MKATSYGALYEAPGFIRKDLNTDANYTPDQPDGTLRFRRAR
jgi:hypothetical protein